MPKLTDAARELRGRSTEAEARLWYHLRAHRLDGLKFKRQQPIGQFIVDFACFERNLIVEADGSQHLESEPDRDRDAWLAAQGFRVLRFWNDDILQRTERVLESILYALRGPSPLAPLRTGERGARREDH
ncbi:MAG: endonuclease domain-containing protein [Xanthomonadales bacterium]|nr:endonuclease domain-containing protein [Xanthomonadales bacterium]